MGVSILKSLKRSWAVEAVIRNYTDYKHSLEVCYLPKVTAETTHEHIIQFYKELIPLTF